MNKRIRELAEEFAMHTETMTGIETEYIFDLEDLDRFAELIVAECIDAALEAQADYYVINNIKSRLGVEE